MSPSRTRLATLPVVTLLVIGCSSPTHGTDETPDATAVEIPVAEPSATHEPTPRTHTLTGSVTVMAGATDRTGLGEPVPVDVCFNGTDFLDVDRGAPVTVRDGSGRIIAATKLTGFQFIETHVGEMMDMTDWDPLEEPLRDDFPLVEVTHGHCQFSFQAEGVPELDFYTVEVGQRGEVVFSRADVEDAGWAVELEVG